MAGNVATASPIGDSLPLLLTLDASVIIESYNKKIILPLNNFFIGYRKTRLKKGQFIKAIKIPIFKKNIFKAFKISKRIDDDISSIDLFEVDKYAHNFPNEISSGEQQRVAIARAMAPNPKILLMDEPFGTLDHSLTHQLRIETKKVLKDNKITAIIVSHDFDDAISMSDRVIVIEEGAIKQQGTAKDITNIVREKSIDFSSISEKS